MPVRSAPAIIVFCLAATLAACDDGKVSDLSFADARRAAAEGKDPFEQVRGKRVQWSGQVVDAFKQFEDDYMETAVLSVDLDMVGVAPAAADVVMKIPLSEFPRFKPGQPITFTGKLREYETQKGQPVLKVEFETAP